MTSKVDMSRVAVQKTGKAFAIVLTLVAAFSLWKSGLDSMLWRWLLGGAAAFLLLGYFAYPVFKHFHFIWMKFAFALGWVMTRVILGIFYYLIMTPVGLLLRLFGKDLLNEKMDRSATSYWIIRDLSKFDPKHITRTF